MKNNFNNRENEENVIFGTATCGTTASFYSGNNTVTSGTSGFPNENNQTYGTVGTNSYGTTYPTNCMNLQQNNENSYKTLNAKKKSTNIENTNLTDDNYHDTITQKSKNEETNMSFVGMVSVGDGIIYFADSKFSVVNQYMTYEAKNDERKQKLFESNNFALVTYGNNTIGIDFIEEIIINIISENPNISIDSFCKKISQIIKIDNNNVYNFIFGYKNKSGKYVVSDAIVKYDYYKLDNEMRNGAKYSLGNSFNGAFSYIVNTINYHQPIDVLAGKFEHIFKALCEAYSYTDAYNPVGDKIELKIFKR